MKFKVTRRAEKPTDMIPCMKCKKERQRKDFVRKSIYTGKEEKFWVCNHCAEKWKKDSYETKREIISVS